MRALAAILFILTGCAASGDALDPSTVDGTDTLIAYLEDRGFTLEAAGLTTSTIPLTVAATYRVTGVAQPAVLEVFEFESDAAAEAGLAQLRSEIQPRVRRELYARGPLVVRLDAEERRRGTNAGLRVALSEALGTARGL